MSAYLNDIGRYEKETNWSTSTSRIYQSNHYSHVKDIMENQGFKNK